MAQSPRFNLRAAATVNPTRATAKEERKMSEMTSFTLNKKKHWPLFVSVLAGLLMASTATYATEDGLAWWLIFFAAILLLMVATSLGDFNRPKTALSLTAVLSGAYWLFRLFEEYGFCLVTEGPGLPAEPSALYLFPMLFLISFLAFSFYPLAVFLREILTKGKQWKIAVGGLIALLVQGDICFQHISLP